MDMRKLRPQVEGILCIFLDLPFFFSLQEFEVLLGYRSNNNDIKKALKRMLEENMIILKEDQLETTKYYLGPVAMGILGHTIIPDITGAPPAEHALSIQACLDNQTKHGNIRLKKRKAASLQQAATTPSAPAFMSTPSTCDNDNAIRGRYMPERIIGRDRL
jgi:hypothetical protein